MREREEREAERERGGRGETDAWRTLSGIKGSELTVNAPSWKCLLWNSFEVVQLSPEGLCRLWLCLIRCFTVHMASVMVQCEASCFTAHITTLVFMALDFRD